MVHLKPFAIIYLNLGLVVPASGIILGEMTNEIIPGSPNLIEKASKYASFFCIIAIAVFVASSIGFSLWMITGERQNLEFRKEYFKAILRQNIGWFDSINPNELATIIANDTQAIQSALGSKFSTFFYILAMLISGYIIGFIWNWKLTCVGIDTYTTIYFRRVLYMGNPKKFRRNK